MRYLLDTNAVIGLLADRASRIAHRARSEHPSNIVISSVVLHELYYGAFKSSHPDRNASVIDALQFQVLELDREDARQAGRIRAVLAAKGMPIGPLDLLIAGQSVARGCVLITHNLREFSRVPGLTIEDWQQD